MLGDLRDLLRDDKNQNLALLTGGALGLMAGAKATPLAMAAKGLLGLEEDWRRRHPEFRGSLVERWREAAAFYEQTHQDRTNRGLHTVGIPMILGGFLGMVAMPRYTPMWWASNGAWTAGWILNFVGHGVFEKSAPAFSDDPLSFLAGPAWDLARLRDRLQGARAGEDAPAARPAAQAA